ncbi:MAG: SDR family NAD(P)-dependent oxidoreductase, partial [Candidatus Methylacidiphilales bacterium]
PEHLGTLRNLRDIIAFISEKAAPAGAPATAPVATSAGSVTPTAAAPTAPAPAASATGLADILLDVVADKTGYPRETLGLDMDLESDLGIDSIKRVEILAGMRQRAPEAPSVEPEHLGSLRTLQDILNFLGERMAETGQPPGHSGPPPLPVAAAEPVGAARSFFEQASRPPAVERRELIATAISSAPTAQLRVAPGHEVLVVGGNDASFGRNLITALQSEGAKARFLSYDAALPGSFKAGGVPIGGLIFLGAETSCVPAQAEVVLKQAFEILKSHAADLRAAARKGGSFVATVSHLNGQFGIGSNFGDVANPVFGGLAGLAKTVAAEWSGVNAIAFDVAGTPTDKVADALVQELAAVRFNEIGINSESVVPFSRLELVEKPFPTATTAWTSQDVIVVTGGARGVTASSALALAEAFAAQNITPTIVLMGRTAPPAPEPQWLKGVEGEAAIKRAILEDSRAQGKALNPKAIGDAYRALVANREVSETVAKLQTLVHAEYVQTDVRSAESIQNVLAQVRAKFGAITGLVHGAGLLEDKRIEEKTTAQFNTVFDTKAGGLRFLLEATAADPLKAIVFFSSVSGRFGRRGQIDYSMANEVLNKVAQSETRRRPHCRVVSLNWGPWEGGMVTPGLRREFEKEGVGLIPLVEGARAFVAEFLAPAGVGAVEVTLGSVLTEPEPTAHAAEAATTLTPAVPTQDAAPAAASPVEVTGRTISLETYPVLRSHCLAGKPVVPLALIMEWFADAALLRHPGAQFLGLERVQVLKGITLDSPRAEVRILAGTSHENDRLAIPLEIVSAGNSGASGRIHARATAILSRAGTPAVRPTEAAPALPALQPYRLSPARAYREVLFHGPQFQAITQVGGISSTAMAASVSVAPAPSQWVKNPQRPAWITDPLLVDSAFQLAILWCQENLGAPSLPARLESYEQLAPFPTRGSVELLFRVENSTKQSARGQFIFHAAGKTLARILGFECTVNAALVEAFDKGRTTEFTSSNISGSNTLPTSPVLRAPMAGE